MNHKYQILQLNESNEELLRNKSFISWEELQTIGGFDINDYKVVYTGEVETTEFYNFFEILNGLFCVFNRHHPEDYKGHSLSMSDVVILDGITWYCDTFGWKEVQ